MENNFNVEIVERDPKSFAFHPSNPRDHSDESVARLAESIQEDPLYFRGRPILLSDRTGKLVVIGGEGRTRAALLLGLDSVPSVVFHGLTEEDEVRIMQKDNSHTGKWDDAKLAEMAAKWGDEKMKNWAPDVKWKANGQSVAEDDFNEKEKPEPKCKNGDIWVLGNHRLMCGDSSDEYSVRKLMGGCMSDISFFSPPYNTGGIGKDLRVKNGRSKYINSNDDMPSDEYTKFISDVIRNAMDHSLYTFVNIQLLANNKDSLLDIICDNRKSLSDVIVWDKGRSQPQLAENVLNSEYEFIFVFSKNGTRRIGTIDFHGTLKNIVHISPTKNDYSKIHNAVYPVQLCGHFVENFAKSTVLDLFGGTGTTIIAAEQLGRRCYMMEIDPNYCDVIIKRWEDFTGKKAQRLNG